MLSGPILNLMKCTRLIKDRQKVGGNSTLLNYPCGQCKACRITKRQQWTYRLLLEAREHKFVYFVTLTYNDECLPENGSLKKSDLQDWIRSVRKRSGKKIRYYAVGEYGERKTKRPHYHIMVFSDEEFPLKYGLVKERGRYMEKVVDSDFNRAWFKDCRVSVDPIFSGPDFAKVAGYVSGYVVKKITNMDSVNQLFGDGVERTPEFALMSRKPGIGLDDRYLVRIAAAIKKLEIDVTKIQMCRINGKLYPLHRNVKDRLVKLVGTQKTELVVALLRDLRIRKEIRNSDMETQMIEELENEIRAKRFAEKLRKTKVA